MNEFMEITETQKEKYLARRHIDLKSLYEAVDFKNKNDLFMIGHKIKGSGATFGFSDIGAIGSKIEEAASLMDWNEIKELITQFESLLSSKSSFR